MELIDHAGEWRRLAEHYRQMTDGELVALARQPSALTDVAQQALAQEVSSRKLKIPPQEPEEERTPEPQRDGSDEDDPFAEQREFTEIAFVWSLQDAQKLQGVLDAAGIPFCIGPEKATRADAVRSNFSDGLGVQVMKVAAASAHMAMVNYSPEDEPPEWATESDDLAIRCPKCHSTEVVFEELDPQPEEVEGKPSSKFKWRCDSCGNEWEDEGVETEE
jgi:DNA-directed RNA polymerase subunit M/transcription elongation factor TFIIS